MLPTPATTLISRRTGHDPLRAKNGEHCAGSSRSIYMMAPSPVQRASPVTRKSCQSPVQARNGGSTCMAAITIHKPPAGTVSAGKALPARLGQVEKEGVATTANHGTYRHRVNRGEENRGDRTREERRRLSSNATGVKDRGSVNGAASGASREWMPGMCRARRHGGTGTAGSAGTGRVRQALEGRSRRSKRSGSRW